jgi:hypothetical protein
VTAALAAPRFLISNLLSLACIVIEAYTKDKGKDFTWSIDVDVDLVAF